MHCMVVVPYKEKDLYSTADGELNFGTESNELSNESGGCNTLHIMYARPTLWPNGF